ncbi:MAG: NrfD/PsrC family molybdoenzyme membrane anchor subunit [Dehalococcoidia bacterium]
MTTQREELKLRPLLHTGPKFYLWIFVLLGMTVAFAYAWITQMSNGLVVTGLRDYGLPLSGSPWGLYISTFIWFVGIAHGGIAISAGIRIMKLVKYRSIARMAELLTLVCLLMAGLMVVVDLGRPDRIVNLIRYWPERIGQSPLTWDFTVILLYFVFSATYLFLTMRKDLARIVNRFPGRRIFYRPLLVGYSSDEHPKVDRIAWWVAISLLILLILLSGGVVPWLFGLVSSQSGWFGGIQGPYFLVAALASSIAAVILIAALLRRIFRWEELIPVDIFRKLGGVLAILTLLYLWFILHEHITAQFAAPAAEGDVSSSLLSGRFAPLFWVMFGGLAVAFHYLAAQAIWQRAFRLRWVVGAAVVIVVGLWVKRVLIVVSSLLLPSFGLYPEGDYAPTWVEWLLVIGAVTIAALMYTAFTKIYPIMELEEETES